MKRILYILVVTLTFSLGFIHVSGAEIEGECSSNNVSIYRKMADNLTYRYVPNVGNKNTFTVEIYNLTDKLVVKRLESGVDYEKILETYSVSFDEKGFGSISIKSARAGETYLFSVRPTAIVCEGMSLKNFSIILPFYNEYYEDKLCTDNLNLSTCRKYTESKVSKKDIENEINSKNKKRKDGITDGVVEKLETKNYDNAVYYIGGIILLGFIISFVFYFNKKKKR